jgi:hypothetical protein
MGTNRSFDRRALEEVERIKAEEAAEEERKQARMKALAEQARKRREAEASEEAQLRAGRQAQALPGGKGRTRGAAGQC